MHANNIKNTFKSTSDWPWVDDHSYVGRKDTGCDENLPLIVLVWEGKTQAVTEKLSLNHSRLTGCK